MACTSNCFSSVGMLLFNKLAVQALPLECSLVPGCMETAHMTRTSSDRSLEASVALLAEVWLQLFFAAFFMLIFGFPYLHLGRCSTLSACLKFEPVERMSSHVACAVLHNQAHWIHERLPALVHGRALLHWHADAPLANISVGFWWVWDTPCGRTLSREGFCSL